MTGGRVLVGECLTAGDGPEAARLLRRAALLSRLGGGTLIAPVLGDERVLSPGVRHLPVRIPPGSSAERMSNAVADAVGEHLSALRPRLVHCMGVSAALPALLRRRSGCATLVEPGVLPSQRLRDEEPRLPPERLADLVALEDKTLGAADAVIARSFVEAATLARRGVQSDRLHTARDGVPQGTLPGPLPGLPNIVSLSDAEPWSAPELALDALVRLKHPWRLAQLLPEGASAGAFEARARALHCSERVVVSRDASAENLAARLAGAQVVVCTLVESRAVEAGGVVPTPVLWGLAAGRPVVAPDLAAVRAYAGAAPVYYEAGDAGSLARALGALLDDAAARDAAVERSLEAAALLGWEDGEQPVADLWRTMA